MKTIDAQQLKQRFIAAAKVIGKRKRIAPGKAFELVLLVAVKK